MWGRNTPHYKFKLCMITGIVYRLIIVSEELILPLSYGPGIFLAQK